MPAAVASKKNLYEVLGLDEDASEDAIRVAYKKLALKWHPDRHQDDKEAAQEKFIEIKDAYTTLLEGRKHSRRFRRPHPATPPPSTAPSTSSSHSASSSSSKTSSTSSSSSQSKSSTSSSSSSKSKSSSSSSDNSKKDNRSRHSTEPHTEKKRSEPAASSRSSHSTAKPEPKSTPRTKPPPRPSTPFTCSDSDLSSDDEEDNDRRRKRSDPFGSHSSGRKKHRPLEEQGYEFIDFGSPLQPLRAPSVKSSTKSGKSGELSKDWIFPLHLSLDDLYHGASHHYRIIRTLRSGKTQTVKIDIKVLPGWHKGTRIRVPGVGNERKDGTFQDIVFVVDELPHAQFSRTDNDLYVAIQVPWADARSRPYSWSSMDSRLDDDPNAKDELAFVKGLNGEEYALPIPVSLVEAADGTRIVGAGMPIREKGEVVGKGDLVIKWEFIFPETEKAQQSRWQSLKKKAMNWKL